MPSTTARPLLPTAGSGVRVVLVARILRPAQARGAVDDGAHLQFGHPSGRRTA